jgi:hypothetical protein
LLSVLDVFLYPGAKVRTFFDILLKKEEKVYFLLQSCATRSFLLLLSKKKKPLSLQGDCNSPCRMTATLLAG